MVLARDLKDPANLHHYTNAAVNYFRAARSFLMFPMVFYVRDDRSLENQTGLSDVQLATSRDGVHWLRPLPEAFPEPGSGPTQLGGPKSHHGAGGGAHRTR